MTPREEISQIAKAFEIYRGGMNMEKLHSFIEFCSGNFIADNADNASGYLIFDKAPTEILNKPGTAQVGAISKAQK